MRKILDTLYDAAGYLAAFFMVGILLMVLASVVGRLAGFNLRGSDAYAGYCMAAAGFLDWPFGEGHLPVAAPTSAMRLFADDPDR